MHNTKLPVPEGTHRRDAFLITLAQALHLFGTPSYRLEEAMEAIARDLDTPLQILATPTSVTVAIGSLEDQRMFLLRVEPSEANLEKLADLQKIMQQVSRGEFEHRVAKDKIDEIVKRKPRYGRVLTSLGYTLTSGCVAILFGGGLLDAAIGTAAGFLIGLLSVYSWRRPRVAAILPAMAAAIAAVIARIAGHFLPGIHPVLVTLSALIVLLPGLALTMGVNELAHRHLVSGTARLMGALVVLLQLGLGVAAGWGLAGSFFGAFEATPTSPGNIWLVVGAVVVAAGAFTILFKARPRDFWAVLAGGGLAYTAARLGTALYGPEFGAALGAWSLGCLANILARLRDKPALTTILPGIILLVPGSLGFKSIQALISDEVILGVETGLTTIMVSISLVVGLFLSNLTINSRKLL